MKSMNGILGTIIIALCIALLGAGCKKDEGGKDEVGTGPGGTADYGSFTINGAGYTNKQVTLVYVSGGLYSGETSIVGAGLSGADTVTFGLTFKGSSTGTRTWSDTTFASVQVHTGSGTRYFISLDGRGTTSISSYGNVGGTIVGTFSGQLIDLSLVTDTITVSNGSFSAIRTQ